MSNKLILILAAALIFIGLVKPNFNLPINNPGPTDSIVIVIAPDDAELKQQCEPIIDILKKSNDRKQDGRRLSDLYSDLATLIRLDSENEVVKTTEEIRQANSLSGLMLQMNLKDKYEGLSEAAQNVLSNQIGDDIVPLDENLRSKAVKAFMGLAWACNEGSK